MASGGLAETIQVVVRPKQHRLGEQNHTGLLSNLPGGSRSNIFVRFDTAGGDLGARLGMVPVLKDQ